jgi:hypothetical protein
MGELTRQSVIANQAEQGKKLDAIRRSEACEHLRRWFCDLSKLNLTDELTSALCIGGSGILRHIGVDAGRLKDFA